MNSSSYAPGFRTHVAGPIDIQGTSMQGSIQATMKELTRAFGNPQASAHSRSTTCWDILFEDGTVATIYDWGKDEWSGAPRPDSVVFWHIGGKDRRAVYLVHQQFRSLNGLMGMGVGRPTAQVAV